jgi:hypothetical protein
MSQAVTQRSFASGELSPALSARVDLPKYSLGLRTCRNFLVQKHGGVANRAGFSFIEYIKRGVAYRAAALALTPTNHYKLQETNGTIAFDAGSAARSGDDLRNPTQGVDSPVGLALGSMGRTIRLTSPASEGQPAPGHWPSGSSPIPPVGRQPIRGSFRMPRPTGCSSAKTR